MDLVSLILYCASAGTPATLTLVHQVATSVDGDPYHVYDVTRGEVYTPAELDTASQIVKALVEAGHDVRVGLTQLPARYVMQTYGLTSRDVLDACRNVSVGADLLTASGSTEHDARTVLVHYFEWGASSDELDGLLWAIHVLNFPSVTVSQDLSLPDSPVPSRRYTATEQIFVGTRDEASPKLAPLPVQELFVQEQKQPQASSSRPRKWRPTPQAQPDVTNEKLLTSEELQELKGKSP